MEAQLETSRVAQAPRLPPQRPLTQIGRTGRVLVADDDAEMRHLVAALLRKNGYRVAEASDGVEVLDRIESTIWHERHDLFDAIVSDINMPGLNGLDLLAALRCSKVETPVILITAFGDADTRAEAGWLGAVALLDKPLNAAQLQAAVERALEPSA